MNTMKTLACTLVLLGTGLAMTSTTSAHFPCEGEAWTAHFVEHAVWAGMDYEEAWAYLLAEGCDPNDIRKVICSYYPGACAVPLDLEAAGITVNPGNGGVVVHDACERASPDNQYSCRSKHLPTLPQVPRPTLPAAPITLSIGDDAPPPCTNSPGTFFAGYAYPEPNGPAVAICIGY